MDLMLVALFNMDDKKLIKCVRRYTFLYDVSHEKYMDTKYKARTWKQIGEELKQPDLLCKSRWQNIRDQFKKYCTKKVTRSGVAAKKIRKHKFEDLLSFLLPHFAEKNTASNIYLSTASNYDIDDTQRSVGDDEDKLELGQLSHIDQNMELSTVSTSIKDNDEKSHSSMSIKDAVQQIEANSSKLMEYVLNKQRIELQESCNPHPMDAFLSGVAPTLKNFSPYYQHVAKGRIFEIVQELEFQQLKKENLSRPSSPVTCWSSRSTPTRQPTNECSAHDPLNSQSHSVNTSLLSNSFSN